MSRVDLEKGQTTKQEVVSATQDMLRLRGLAYNASGFKSIQTTCVYEALRLLENLDDKSSIEVLLTLNRTPLF